jgi:tetratricopeptide (TPR) repeat protein
MAPMGWGAGGKVTNAQKLIAKARDASAADPIRGIVLYTRAIDLLNAANGFEREKKLLLGPAELGRGQLLEKTGQEELAVESYLRANILVHPLPLPALAYVAKSLAKRGDAGNTAMPLYMDLVRSLRGRKSKPEGASAVYEFLEEQCVVAVETGDSRPQAALCQRLIDTDSSLDWAHYYVGLQFLKDQNFREAIRSLDRCHELNSAKPLLAYHRAFAHGVVQARAKVWDRAAAHFQDAWEAAPDRAVVRVWLGKCLVEKCEGLSEVTRSQLEVEAAVRELTKACQAGKNAEEMSYLARAYLLAGRYQEAEQSLEAAVQNDPKDLGRLVRLALCWSKLGKLGPAADAAKAAVAIDPKLIPAHRLLATISFENADYEMARNHFNIVVSAEPADHSSREKLGLALYHLRQWKNALSILRPLDASSDAVLFAVARCHAHTGAFDSALPLLIRLTQRTPFDTQVFYCLGLAHAHRREFREALQQFDRALLSGTAPPCWYLHRGHVHSELGNIASARKDYERAVQLQPDHAEALYCLGRLHLAVQEYGLARPCLERLLKLDPKHFGGMIALASVYEQAWELDSALHGYAAAAALNPKSALPRRCLGIIHYRLGDHDTAWNDLSQAIALGDQSDETIYYLGQTAAETGRIAEAFAAWSQLHERHPGDQRLFLNLGRLRYLLGQKHAKDSRFADAAVEWEHFLEVRPGDEDLRQELAKLYLRVALPQFPANSAAAFDALSRASELDEGNPVYEYYSALCCLDDENWAFYAATVPDLLAKLCPQLQLHAYYHLGLAHMVAEEFDCAAALFHGIDTANDPFAVALDTSLPVALLHARAGRWAEAARVLTVESR